MRTKRAKKDDTQQSASRLTWTYDQSSPYSTYVEGRLGRCLLFRVNFDQFISRDDPKPYKLVSLLPSLTLKPDNNHFESEEGAKTFGEKMLLHWLDMTGLRLTA